MLIILPEASTWHGGDSQKDDVEKEAEKNFTELLKHKPGIFSVNPCWVSQA